jgi:hypothetical protein
MGCRTFSLEIGAGMRSFELDNEIEESVEFMWS